MSGINVNASLGHIHQKRILAQIFIHDTCNVLKKRRSDPVSDPRSDPYVKGGSLAKGGSSAKGGSKSTLFKVNNGNTRKGMKYVQN